MIIPKKFKKIFITGGAGFIGSHIADILVESEKDVIVFDNLSAGKKEFLINCIGKSNFKLIQGDISHPTEIKKALDPDTDIVFHLAANPDIAKGFIDPSLDLNQTIIATFNLLQEMKNKNIKNLVYFSGSGVYGNVGNTFTDENFGPLKPVSMYGASKLAAEGLISAFSHLYNINSWIFRPANVVGDRATHGVILDFINKLKKNPNQLEILGDGQQSKSYIYVTDVITAVFFALRETHERVNILNIGTDTFTTVNEIGSMVINAMKLKNVKIVHTSGKGGWPGDIPVVRINTQKLRTIGWKEKYSSQKAIQRTIKNLLK